MLCTRLEELQYHPLSPRKVHANLHHDVNLGMDLKQPRPKVRLFRGTMEVLSALLYGRQMVATNCWISGCSSIIVLLRQMFLLAAARRAL